MILGFTAIQYTFVTKDYVLLASVSLNLLLLSYIYIRYYYSITPFLKIRIRKPRKDFPEFKIKIRNTGIIPVEIAPPVIIFKKRGNKRVFQVRNDTTSFPLALFRKEDYDFMLDLARFYSSDGTLITYPKAYLEVRNKDHKKIARKRMNIQF